MKITGQQLIDIKERAQEALGGSVQVTLGVDPNLVEVTIGNPIFNRALIDVKSAGESVLGCKLRARQLLSRPEVIVLSENDR